MAYELQMQYLVSIPDRDLGGLQPELTNSSRCFCVVSIPDRDLGGLQPARYFSNEIEYLGFNP